MKNKLALVLCLIWSISISANGISIEIPTGIIQGFKNGNAAKISDYFGSSIELTINNKENIYSKTQAELILKDFFKKNPPTSFSILHDGGKGESKYAIGSLKTANESYRVTLLIKVNNNKPEIHQLTIVND